MKTRNVYSAYFSATYSTKRVVNEIANRLGSVASETDMTCSIPESAVSLGHDDLLVVGVPVYGGRIPQNVIPALKSINGNDTPAVVITVYGNRNYDDALVELYDIVKANGFKVIGAAAVIAEHCIFPKVATGRPDIDDWNRINKFCSDVSATLSEYNVPEEIDSSAIRGKRPYKKLAGTPVHPSAGKECNACGICAGLCPVGAISLDNPRITDTSRCISCCRCINVCPRDARKFRGILPKIIGSLFTKTFSKRREPEFITSRHIDD